MEKGGGRHTLPGFDPSLDGLRTDVTLMGALVRRSFLNARRGFEERDDDYCAAVIADDEEVDLLEKQVDKSGTDILMRFTPLAFDLRVVLATIKTAGLLERIADTAVNIARRARKLNAEDPLEEAQLAQPAFDVIDGSLSGALGAFDKWDGASANAIRTQMEPIAEQARYLDETFSSLIPEKPHGARVLVNLMGIAQGLEVIAYLLESITEEIIYVAEAKDVRHSGNRLTLD